MLFVVPTIPTGDGSRRKRHGSRRLRECAMRASAGDVAVRYVRISYVYAEALSRKGSGRCLEDRCRLLNCRHAGSTN
jgi:hypothetical protein